MREMSAQRRKVVVMAASVAVLGGAEGSIWPNHLSARWEFVHGACVGLVLVLAVRVIVLFVKLKREEG